MLPTPPRREVIGWERERRRTKHDRQLSEACRGFSVRPPTELVEAHGSCIVDGLYWCCACAAQHARTLAREVGGGVGGGSGVVVGW